MHINADESEIIVLSSIFLGFAAAGLPSSIWIKQACKVPPAGKYDNG